MIGDSKLNVEWANGNFNLENLQLVPLMDRNREARTKFMPLSFQRVYRELNMEAGIMYKEALRMQKKWMELIEVIDQNIP